jgi:hypothetical protein
MSYKSFQTLIKKLTIGQSAKRKQIIRARPTLKTIPKYANLIPGEFYPLIANNSNFPIRLIPLEKK